MPIANVTDALDLKGLADVKRQAHEGSAEGTRKAAREFEAMFLNMMLKGMRESLSHDDPLETDATRMATSMYDGQLAQSMAGKGLGLADAIVKQIERSQALKTPASTNNAVQSTGVPIPLNSPATGAIPLRHGLLRDKAPAQVGPMDFTSKRLERSLRTKNPAPIDESSTPNPTSREVVPAPLSQSPQFKTGSVQQNFVDMHRQAAEAASRASGIPTKVILGQAALESGWGKHEVRDASGTGSFNLFGIKAGKTWKGATVESVTTEFVAGVAQKVVQKFRAYASYAESFLDHAKLVSTNPRYSHVMQATDDAVRFAQEMGRSGYATDPSYGEKLTQIVSGPLRQVG